MRRIILTVLIGTIVAFATMAPVAASATFSGRNTASQTTSTATLSFPANFTCNNITRNAVTIDWDPPAGVSASAVRYNVGRKLPDATGYTTIAAGIQPTNYHESAPVTIGTVTYSVQAVFKSWTSSWVSPAINANFLVVGATCTIASS